MIARLTAEWSQDRALLDGLRALPEGTLLDLATYYGFTIRRVRDLPKQTRSVTDLANDRAARTEANRNMQKILVVETETKTTIEREIRAMASTASI